jgi:mono/diheme cytochrome c family protein
MKSSFARPLALAVVGIAIAACSRKVEVVSTAPSPTGTGAAAAAAPKSGLPSDVTPAMIDSGKVLFAGRCQRCHGPAGAGAANAPALNDDKWNQPTVNGSFESLLAIIHSGVPQANIKGDNGKTYPFAMRPDGGANPPYSPEQLRMIAGYVYTLSHK